MTTRRMFVIGSAALALSACSSTGKPSLNANVIQVDEPWASYYSYKADEPFPVAGIDIRKIPQQFWRQEVAYSGADAPGTIVVNTTDRFLYLVQPNGRAIRYGVGVGREEGLNF
ncbi:MAG: L,D-transpeptidase, partial [Burkholderiales bacterium]